MNEQVSTQNSKRSTDKSRVLFPETSNPELDLNELFRKIWRWKSLVFGTTITVTLLSLIIILQIPPKYVAETTVMIEETRSNVVNLEAVVSGLAGDTGTVYNEIEVLRSRGLISKLVSQLQLEQVKELNPTKRHGMRTAISAFFSNEKTDAELTEGELRAKERAQVVDHVLSQLTTAPKGASRVISISFKSRDPKLAAKIVNSLADLYIVEQLEVKFAATQRAAQWLNEHIGELQDRVKKSERAVEAFRAQSDLLQDRDRGTTLASQNMVELNAELVKAETAYAVAKARLKQVRELSRGTNDYSAIAEVMDSTLIQKLREEQARVERKLAELSVEYGERHPKMVNARAEVVDLQKSIEVEVHKIMKVLAQKVDVAKARRDSLKKSLNQTKLAVSKANKQQVFLRSLEREANADRMLLNSFMEKFKVTSAQEDKSAHLADARIISRADVPLTPTSPKKKVLLFVAFVGGFSLGVGIALFIEFLDHGFRTADQLEKTLKVSILSHIPLLKRADGRTEDYIIDNPISEYGEAIRTLHTGLLLSHIDNPPKSVVITSALPHEGKSTTAISLVRLIAKGGSKVLLIDADLRKPSIASNLKIQDHPGLIECLRKEVSFKDAIQVDKLSGAHIITSGETTPNSSDIISSDNMVELLRKAEEEYDLVILDTPPVLAVSDARILATKVSSTIFVVRWAETSRHNAMIGLKQLLDARADIAGTLLTLVDMKKLPKYQGRSSSYYYRQEADLYFEPSK